MTTSASTLLRSRASDGQALLAYSAEAAAKAGRPPTPKLRTDFRRARNRALSSAEISALYNATR